MFFILLIYISLFKSVFLFPLILVFRSLKVIYLDMLFDIYPALFPELFDRNLVSAINFENLAIIFFKYFFAQLFYSRVKVMYLLAHLFVTQLLDDWFGIGCGFLPPPTEVNIHLSHGFAPYVYVSLGLSSIISVSI